MPKRTDIRKILILGSGPIIIGQACEFDYSGSQACKALKEEGYQVILINSNPATIMTDPELADATFVEPITPEAVEKIIQREKPDAILPTLGGQTGLNTAIALHHRGILKKYNVKLIGASPEAIMLAEDREQFKAAMIEIGLDVPRSQTVRSVDEALTAGRKLGFPCIVRASFTLGGTGGGIVWNVDELEDQAAYALDCSLNHEILIEESILGWKEFELEVMRDRADNVVIICTIENFDPMGVHTGDSITVAPIQTLTDKEYQRMRDAACAIMRRVGVETGGSNVQFAVHPDTGRMIVIEMNPRVSRSSALASKATGFPIAKMAAKLAVGYTLDEIQNDITKETPACFEPTIDYCVVKLPRFTFEKFPDTQPVLGISMKSVGETMAIGRTFKEALQKALRGLETGRSGLGLNPKDRAMAEKLSKEELRSHLITPNPERLIYVRYALKQGMSIDEVYHLSKIDKWFLYNIKEIIDFQAVLQSHKTLEQVPADLLREAKRMGFSDVQLAIAWNTDQDTVRARRKALGIEPVYKLVDTCAAEFEAHTPYYYSTYEEENEVRVSKKKKIMILGGGPNRIGQGIEFDYCCVHAAYALKELGYETIMVNSNPETVSTDYDTSDQLFFEPLTLEDVLNIYDRIKPDGVIVQFGGQTPLKLAKALERHGVPIIGTSPESIDIAEDRKRFAALVQQLGIRQPDNGTATSPQQAHVIANRIGYPVLVRPSYVLGGRAMEIVFDDSALDDYMHRAVEASPEHPILIDQFLQDAVEIDVDCISDGDTIVIGGIMEHIEEAGIHSGDSTCTIPTYSLPPVVLDEIRQTTHKLAQALEVKGLMNVQYALKGGDLYVLEVNPRASRTSPFVSKAIGVPLAKLAAKVMVGKTLKELGFTREIIPKYYSIKQPVFPFNRFKGVDIILGPEMRSTGEAMGIDPNLGIAFAKAHMAVTLKSPPKEGEVFISVQNDDKQAVIPIAQTLHKLGFKIFSTSGTAAMLQKNKVPVDTVFKIAEGRPHAIDRMKNNNVVLVINTPSGKGARTDEAKIRALTLEAGIPCITTIRGAQAAVAGIEAALQHDWQVRPLQEYYRAGK